MEETASGFSEPIVTIFKPIFQTKTYAEKQYYDKHNVLFKFGFAEIKLMKFFEEYLYLPVANFVMKVLINFIKNPECY